MKKDREKIGICELHFITFVGILGSEAVEELPDKRKMVNQINDCHEKETTMVCRTEAQVFINDLQRGATARAEFADRLGFPIADGQKAMLGIRII
jgi:hypothetical protein